MKFLDHVPQLIENILDGKQEKLNKWYIAHVHIFSFEDSLFLAYEISLSGTWKIISKKAITIWQQQTIFTSATIWFDVMPDKIPNSFKTSSPVSMSIPPLVCASSPPVPSPVNQSAVLEEYQLASDKVHLQLGPDLQKQGVILWGLTDIACLLPADLWRAVEVEATQASEGGVDPVLRAETRRNLLPCLVGHLQSLAPPGGEKENCQ